jgi:hypothetical protein
LVHSFSPGGSGATETRSVCFVRGQIGSIGATVTLYSDEGRTGYRELNLRFSAWQRAALQPELGAVVMTASPSALRTRASADAHVKGGAVLLGASRQKLPLVALHAEKNPSLVLTATSTAGADSRVEGR